MAYINEHDRDEGWIQKVAASSSTYWVALLLCLGFAGVLQWVSVRLLPVLQGSGAIAVDWGSVAFVQPDKFGVVEQAVFTGAAYLYMSVCFYLFIAGLILLCNLADDFAHISKALEVHPEFMSLNGAHAAVSRITHGIVRASIFGLMVAVYEATKLVSRDHSAERLAMAARISDRPCLILEQGLIGATTVCQPTTRACLWCSWYALRIFTRPSASTLHRLFSCHWCDPQQRYCSSASRTY